MSQKGRQSNREGLLSGSQPWSLLPASYGSRPKSFWPHSAHLPEDGAELNLLKKSQRDFFQRHLQRLIGMDISYLLMQWDNSFRQYVGFYGHCETGSLEGKLESH